jgi:hypothetical protein
VPEAIDDALSVQDAVGEDELVDEDGSGCSEHTVLKQVTARLDAYFPGSFTSGYLSNSML